jgi:hypothetical protein
MQHRIDLKNVYHHLLPVNPPACQRRRVVVVRSAILLASCSTP